MVSIITINYNNAKGLLKTIPSVLNQSYKDIEYIVIDGGSTDSGLEIIKQHADRISYWVSEKDKGVYQAMNKGIAKAKGDYLLFLNSGDYLVDNEIVSKVFSGYNLKEDIVYGDLFLELDGKIIGEKEYPDKITFKHFFCNNDSLPHPASFIKKSLFERSGLYNEELKIVSDVEFWLKSIFLYQATYQRLPFKISIFGMDGMSSLPENREITYREKQVVYNKYFPGFIEDYKKYDEFVFYIKSNRFAKILAKFKLLNAQF